MNPLLLTDGYKTSHHRMYPPNTEVVYSNYTCRSVARMPEQAKKIVVFGIQYTFQYIQEIYQKEFFDKPKNEVCQEAKKYLSSYLGTDYDVTHFEKLHDLGYLPIEVKALPEGTLIDAGIPLFTIKNAFPEFFWLTNYLETLISTLIWKPVHSASLAYAFKQVLLKYATETDKENVGFVNFQGHDFSFRGMQSPESAISSGLGFLTSFMGTDTIVALQAAKHYYGSYNAAFSVPASEHSVMTAYGKEDELGAFKRLIQQYPTGILSVVSDSFDLWKVLTEYLPAIKSEVLARDGKLVIRPDSGDPVDILCGVNPEFGYSGETDIAQNKGVIELLWDIFGGTVNEQGYKVLDSHIGAIYGDSISLERAQQICERLKAKGFASTTVVLGIGSYSMGYATRDNQGGAVKSTAVVVDGELREIFKDPITDDGTKKSKKGLLQVFNNRPDAQGDVLLFDGKDEIKVADQCTWEQEQGGLLQTVFKDGKLVKTTTLEEIRNKLK